MRKGSNTKKNYTFTLTHNTDARLDIMSEELEISRSELVDRAVKAYYSMLKRTGKLNTNKG